MMTYDECIRSIEETVGRKFSPNQRSDLLDRIESDPHIRVLDARMVAQDYLREYAGTKRPSPDEVFQKIVAEAAFRRRREAGRERERDVVEEIEERGGHSYTHKVYARAFGLLSKSRTLHRIEAHEGAVQRAMEIIGPPSPDDTFRDAGFMNAEQATTTAGPPSERVKHFQRVVNQAVAALDFDPFVESDAVQT